jgi:hypothetical protein
MTISYIQDTFLKLDHLKKMLFEQPCFTTLGQLGFSPLLIGQKQYRGEKGKRE